MADFTCDNCEAPLVRKESLWHIDRHDLIPPTHTAACRSCLEAATEELDTISEQRYEPMVDEFKNRFREFGVTR